MGKTGLEKSILALHGFTGCGADFDCLREGLPRTHWDTPDLHASETPEAFPELLAMLIRRFEHLPAQLPRILLGYSMGGRIALHVAQALLRENRWRPQDKLVLISASPGLKTDAERHARRERDAALAAKILAAPSAEAFYAFWQTVPLIATQKTMPEPWRSRLLESRKNADKTHWAQSLKHFGTGTLSSLWDGLCNFNADTMLIFGENDAKFSAIARSMHAELPHSQLYAIPRCGHAPHLEAPTEFISLLELAN